MGNDYYKPGDDPKGGGSMIVFHGFFYKKHPKYLDRAVGMMRNMNECCFVNHKDLDFFIKKIRVALEEDSGRRYENHDVSLYAGNGQLQIEVKNGLDYAARISYINVEKGYFYRVFSEEKALGWKFTPDGEMRFINKDE